MDSCQNCAHRMILGRGDFCLYYFAAQHDNPDFIKCDNYLRYDEPEIISRKHSITSRRDVLGPIRAVRNF